MAGIYIHIPFCKQACYYCDFHFSTDQKFRSTLILALAREIEIQNNYLGNDPIQTIYFGGGTPSLCTKEEFALLLQHIRSNFQVDPSAEITVEANPDDLTEEKLIQLKELGVNRLSIGIQSFSDSTLSFLNRAHHSLDAEKCLHTARNVGFNNISLDLIYAIPNQSHDVWKSNIEKALSFSPEHVSCYSLTIEEKTVFGKQKSKGKFKTVSDDSSAEEFEILMDAMEKAGYDHYEISNFSKPGFHSRHNSNYWKQEKYLGIGPSAHSYDGITRQMNVSNNNSYVQSFGAGSVPFEKEFLTRANKINEYLLTSLRTSWGTDLEKLRAKFQHDLQKENESYLEDLIRRNYAHLERDVLTLTRSGKLIADKIASDLFVAEE